MNTTSFIAVALALCGSLALSGSEQECEFESTRRVREGNVVDATLVLIDGFSPLQARRCVEKFVDRSSAADTVFKVAIFSDKSAADKYNRGKPVQLKRYSEWWNALEDDGWFGGDIALAVITPRGSLLRYRSRLGELHESTMAAGKTGLIPNEIAQILDVHVGEPSPLLGNGEVRMYVRSDSAQSVGDAEKMAAALGQVVRARRITIQIRPDSLFIYDMYFPLRYPFGPGAVPTQQEFEKRPTIICGVDAGQSKCLTFPSK